MAELACAMAIGAGLGLLVWRPRQPAAARHAWPGVLVPAGGASVGALAGWLLTGWPAVAVLAAGVGALLPRSLHAQKAVRRQAEVTDALAEVAAGLRDAVRAGHGLQDAITAMASYGPPGLREEMGRLQREAQLRGLEAGLESFARRLDDPLGDLLASVLGLNARLGGRNLTQSLDALATAIRAEAHTLREVRARQAEQRLSARVVAGIPMMILLALSTTTPVLLEPYGSALGQVVLLAAGGMIASGYALTIRLGRPPRGLRLAPAGGRR